MVPKEMYGEKYGELKHILKELIVLFDQNQNLLFFQLKKKNKGMRKIWKESVCVPFEARDI